MSEIKSGNLMYAYEFGDEEVLGSSIWIYKLDEEDLYSLEFTQTAGGDSFRSVSVGTGEEIDRSVNDSYDEQNLRVRVIRLLIKSILNPRPETLFNLGPLEKSQ